MANTTCNVTFGPNDYIQVDHAHIAMKNFAGKPTKVNRRGGDRSFVWVIPTEELATELTERGWNVKVMPPREEGDEPFMFLPIKIKFNARGPHMFTTAFGRVTRLDEQDCDLIDDMSILYVDMDIRPYDWNVNGKEGRSAYLVDINVVQDGSRFDSLINS